MFSNENYRVCLRAWSPIDLCDIWTAAILHAFGPKALPIWSCYGRVRFYWTCRRWWTFAIWSQRLLSSVSWFHSWESSAGHRPLSMLELRLLSSPATAFLSLTLPEVYRSSPAPYLLIGEAPAFTGINSSTMIEQQRTLQAKLLSLNLGSTLATHVFIKGISPHFKTVENNELSSMNHDTYRITSHIGSIRYPQTIWLYLWYPNLLVETRLLSLCWCTSPQGNTKISLTCVGRTVEIFPLGRTITFQGRKNPCSSSHESSL